MGGGMGGMFPPTPPVIKGLIFINVFLFVLEMVGILPDQILKYLMLYPLENPATPISNWPQFYPWQILSYQFLHSGIPHLLLNMFVLWMFGSEVANRFGRVKFLTFYLMCGFTAAALHLVVSAWVFPDYIPVVGASGSIFGIMVAFAMIDPKRIVYLYFVLPVRVGVLVVGYIALDIFMGMGSSGAGTGVAHFAHIGGAFGGWFLYKHQNDIGLFAFVQRQVDRFSGKGNNSFQYAKYREKSKTEPAWWKTQNKSEGPPSIEDIDAILDKMNAKGYSSLTDKEKRDLEEYSRKR